MALSPVQRLVARRLGAGESQATVAELMKLDKSTVQRWVKELPEMRDAIDIACQEHESIVSALLIAGETKASETLLSALEAENSDGSPNWRMRVSAAINLLDRAGQRGAPIARQEIRADVSSRVAVQTTLVSALKDPTVRTWLTTEPSFAGLLKEAVDAEVIEVKPLEKTNGLPQESGS